MSTDVVHKVVKYEATFIISKIKERYDCLQDQALLTTHRFSSAEHSGVQGVG